MVNSEHVDILRRGVAAWNQWRRENPHIKPLLWDEGEGRVQGIDFGGLDLAGANLSGVELWHADLSRANLAGADLSDAILSYANLTQANLQGANLSGAILRRANLGGVDLRETDLTGAVLRDALLLGARLTPALLKLALSQRAVVCRRSFGVEGMLTSGRHPVEREWSFGVQFTVYHAFEAEATRWQKLLAYAHTRDALQAVQADSRHRLASSASTISRTRSDTTYGIARGAQITVVPNMPGLLVNPPHVSFLWLEDWHCVEFRIKPDSDSTHYEADRLMAGAVEFYVGPVLVGETHVSTLLLESSDKHIPHETPSVTSDPYRSVFVSYSSEDTPIVDRLEKAYSVLGMTYLRDLRVLRSGEQWTPRLLRKIEEADIFQLCWSVAARKSRHVEREWRHALDQQRAEPFIRPMYWERPMAEPPPELADIHFSYYPVQD